jgi:simple sugar transport system substrate-binding protein
MLVTILLASIILAACGTTSQPPAEATQPADTAAETEQEEPADTPDEAAEGEPTGDDEPAASDTDTMTNTETASEGEDTPPESGEPYVFGMVLVGPYNDAGWSQAHYEGALYAEERLDGAKFIYVDKVNPADRPNVTVEQVVDDLVSQEAQFIITNSDDFKDGTRAAAKLHPEIIFLHISGDDALTGEAPDNLGNLMGKMIYGKMIAGCTAVLHSNTGYISYLGPLINDETRRLVNAAYLGATYCNENLRDEPFDELRFKVVWIGFWFNIPGITFDPTQVANDFINEGSDVIISGIDTTEALIEANKASQAGQEIYAIPYDYRDACAQAEEVCLGVPYFNWGPAYVEELQAARAGTWEPSWEWLEPDWNNLNDIDQTPIGFARGSAMTEENGELLDTFIAGLADGSIKLFVGPLNFQDGTVYLEEGEEATEEQIWYTPQLLEGIEGQSVAE